MPSSVLEAGKLRHWIEIVQLTLGQDAKGNISARNESPIATVWASIEPLVGRELYAAQQKVAEVTHRLTIRYYPGLKAGMNIWFNDPGLGTARQFQIQSVENPDETKHFLRLMCMERDNAVREGLGGGGAAAATGPGPTWSPPPGAANLQPAAVFTGDGLTATWTLPKTPAQVLEVFINGLLGISPGDYSVNGANVTPARLLRGAPNPDVMVVIFTA